MTTHVWMCQCLCPKRHAILGGAGLADNAVDAYEKIEAPLRESIERMLWMGDINRWCGICHANAKTWHYETERTRYHTMEEAHEPMRRVEAENIKAGIVLGEILGLGTKKPSS
jgi:hypothetical protein